MTVDPGLAVLVGAVGVVIVNIITALRTTGKIAEVKEKVDGNFSDLKTENTALQKEKAVLIERLLTTTPAEKKD